MNYTLKVKFTHKLAIILVAVAVLAASAPRVEAKTSFLALNSLKSLFGLLHEDEAKAQELPTLPVATEREPRKTITVVATAYSSTVSQTDDDPFTAASGARVYDGIIAANWLKFGTHVKFPELYGDKIFIVDDRMNARYGYGRVDVWLNAPLEEVKQFGVKRVMMEIY